MPIYFTNSFHNFDCSKGYFYQQRLILEQRDTQTHAHPHTIYTHAHTLHTHPSNTKHHINAPPAASYKNRTDTQKSTNMYAPQTNTDHSCILRAILSLHTTLTHTQKNVPHSTLARTQTTYSCASPPRDPARKHGLRLQRLRSLVPAGPPSDARCRRSRRRWPWRFFLPGNHGSRTW